MEINVAKRMEDLRRAVDAAVVEVRPNGQVAVDEARWPKPTARGWSLSDEIKDFNERFGAVLKAQDEAVRS